MTIRLIAAAAVLVSAYVHHYLWFDGVRDQHGVGPLFMVNVVAGVVIAVLLVAWRHWVPLFLSAGFGLATIGAFAISSTVGLYGIEAHWSGQWVWLAFASEVVAVVAAVVAAAREGYLSRETIGRWGVRRADLG